ncbi:unnamed protein product [Phaeothamnion confervicola]
MQQWRCVCRQCGGSSRALPRSVSAFSFLNVQVWAPLRAQSRVRGRLDGAGSLAVPCRQFLDTKVVLHRTSRYVFDKPHWRSALHGDGNAKSHIEMLCPVGENDLCWWCIKSISVRCQWESWLPSGFSWRLLHSDQIFLLSRNLPRVSACSQTTSGRGKKNTAREEG